RTGPVDQGRLHRARVHARVDHQRHVDERGREVRQRRRRGRPGQRNQVEVELHRTGTAGQLEFGADGGVQLAGVTDYSGPDDDLRTPTGVPRRLLAGPNL